MPADGHAAAAGGLRAEHMHLPLDVHEREALARAPQFDRSKPTDAVPAWLQRTRCSRCVFNLGCRDQLFGGIT